MSDDVVMCTVENCPRAAVVPYLTPKILLPFGKRMALCEPHSRVGALQVSSDGRVTVVGEGKP